MEKFHEYNRDVEFSEGRRIAHRPAGIDPISVVFSDRPLKIGQVFAVQIESVGNTEWNTRGIIGLTQVNPNTSPKLPFAVYNDLHYRISSNTLAEFIFSMHHSRCKARTNFARPAANCMHAILIQSYFEAQIFATMRQKLIVYYPDHVIPKIKITIICLNGAFQYITPQEVARGLEAILSMHL